MTAKHDVMLQAAEQSAGRTLDSYPVRLFAHHMAEIYGLTLRRFYALVADGHFDFAEHKPRIGRRAWSRSRVQAHFDGTLAGVAFPHEVARRA